ncbi:peptide ABC transporter substrate-binding protein [Clostridium sediminicola]|uniref:ABC transporter substrate-binding protein n=1 Tax=Clostridium sediminicola TaxID=3114879 RepID=UPI0031F23F51
MKKKLKKSIVRITFNLLIIGFVFAILYLGFIEKKVSANNTKEYIVYNIEEIPQTLNNIPKGDLVQEDILYLLFDGLVIENKDGKIIPQISDSWDISEDGLSYSFHIRDDAYWSNGDKITADDYRVFLFNFLKENSLEYKDLLFNVKGARDYSKGKIQSNSVGITVKDKKTLVFQLYFPDENFLNILSEPCFLLRKDFNKLGEWKKNHNDILYSGAFEIKSYSENDQMTINKNKCYWDSENIKLKELRFKNDDSIEVASGKYKVELIDIMRNTPESERSLLSEKNELFEAETKNSVLYIYNANEGKILRNYQNRKKLTYFISGDSKEENNVEFSLIDDNDICKEGLTLLCYIGDLGNSNVEGAYNLLNISNDLLENLKDANINTILKTVYTKEELKEELVKGDFDIYVTKESINDDIKTFYVKWMHGSIYNIFGYNNCDYDEAVLKYITTSNYNEKFINIKKAAKMLTEDNMYLKLENENLIMGKKEYIKNLEVNSRGNLLLKYAYIDNEKLK